MMASWFRRAVLAGLLLAAYLFAWTPARTAWVTHLATPVLERTSAPTTRVSARPAAHTVRVQAREGTAFTYTAPAGIKFLLPGLFLTVVVAARPRLGLFFGGHLLLGSVTLLLTAAGAAGVPGGLGLADFLQAYGVDTYSLAVPVFIFAGSTRHLEPPQPQEGPTS
jgi:hypothetical protein